MIDNPKVLSPLTLNLNPNRNSRLSDLRIIPHRDGRHASLDLLLAASANTNYRLNGVPTIFWNNVLWNSGFRNTGMMRYCTQSI